jgi:glycerol 2-dehydrogenase (NADP+)
MPVKEDGSRNIDTEWDQAKTWAQMEDVLAKGKVKAIGVSNVSEILLEQLSKTWKVVPAVNQVRHLAQKTCFTLTLSGRAAPILPPARAQEVLRFQEHPSTSILSPWVNQSVQPFARLSIANLADSPLHSDEELKKIAEKHNESVATILISWAVNRGTVVLPKSVTPSRIESNRKVISLDKEDMATLDQMASGGRQHRFNTPAWKTDFVSYPFVICFRLWLMSRDSRTGMV